MGVTMMGEPYSFGVEPARMREFWTKDNGVKIVAHKTPEEQYDEWMDTPGAAVIDASAAAASAADRAVRACGFFGSGWDVAVLLRRLLRRLRLRRPYILLLLLKRLLALLGISGLLRLFGLLEGAEELVEGRRAAGDEPLERERVVLAVDRAQAHLQRGCGAHVRGGAARRGGGGAEVGAQRTRWPVATPQTGSMLSSPRSHISRRNSVSVIPPTPRPPARPRPPAPARRAPPPPRRRWPRRRRPPPPPRPSCNRRRRRGRPPAPPRLAARRSMTMSGGRCPWLPFPIPDFGRSPGSFCGDLFFARIAAAERGLLGRHPLGRRQREALAEVRVVRVAGDRPLAAAALHELVDLQQRKEGAAHVDLRPRRGVARPPKLLAALRPRFLQLRQRHHHRP